MKIALGNDHAGFPLKVFVQSVLEDLGHEVIDVGAPSEVPVDFPDITRATCDLVKSGQAERAVLVCGTGVGAVMAANKIPGIRCALGNDEDTIRRVRKLRDMELEAARELADQI
jgi:ribose 5-phosphate isomerase B